MHFQLFVLIWGVLQIGFHERKFKCPCHGSGFRFSGIHFEGPAPRPLERFMIYLADDGQIVVDKTKSFKYEKVSGKEKNLSLKSNKGFIDE